MATIANTREIPPGVWAASKARSLNPTLCFWIAGLIVYGGAAANTATGHFLNQIPRDLWQHLAALRALIENPWHPTNPFVPTNEFSRHFHPYWVGIALVARTLGWNEWQAFGFAAFVSAGTLLAGIFAFGRTFYRSPWGPLALLAAMAAGWLLPVSHTGYHSIGTLVEGFAYPAVLLIGLSFLLWAVAIRSLENSRWSIALTALSALMFATHPLGAGIGLMVACCFLAFHPVGELRRRAIGAAAIAAGLLATTAWPYFNPFATIIETGNVAWVGGVDFYRPGQLVAALVPQSIGLIALLHPEFRRLGLPIVAAFILFFSIFLCGLLGVMIATRFIMPAVLMLHIGLAALFLLIGRHWAGFSERKRLTLFSLGVTNVTLFLFFSYCYWAQEAREYRKVGNVYVAAGSLVSDIPDNQPVAAYDVAVWPIVATGQRAASIPWPEPGIRDLAARQVDVNSLFDPKLSRTNRLALARKMGVRTLILDKGGPLRRPMPPGIAKVLKDESARVKTAGPFLRFDLY